MGFTIGLIYDRDENWIAGSYYIENLVSALSTLDEKPHLKIYSGSKQQVDELKIRTGYPLLDWVDMQEKNKLIDKAINKVSLLFFKTYWIVRGFDSDVDVLFPASDFYLFTKIKHKLFWIPDFQEKHYPQFFSFNALLKRKTQQQLLVASNRPVIFSSEHACKDFRELYPQAKNQRFVLPFAVTLPAMDDINIDLMRSKYGVTGDYFICSNQFWAHKNHRVVMEALVELRNRGKRVTVVFTGKQSDNRNPLYNDKLMKYVRDNNLENFTKFLGFIDRKEQLIMMKHSIAVIQPSLFEGWSTVIEDAKAMNVSIIVSDIEVHREQLGKYPLYFKKENAADLADKIETVLEANPNVGFPSYEKNVKEFGVGFMNIVKEIIK
jgi:glycosyltransferase involved in cell wall biosynthesis